MASFSRISFESFRKCKWKDESSQLQIKKVISARVDQDSLDVLPICVTLIKLTHLRHYAMHIGKVTSKIPASQLVVLGHFGFRYPPTWQPQDVKYSVESLSVLEIDFELKISGSLNIEDTTQEYPGQLFAARKCSHHTAASDTCFEIPQPPEGECIRSLVFAASYIPRDDPRLSEIKPSWAFQRRLYGYEHIPNICFQLPRMPESHVLARVTFECVFMSRETLASIPQTAIDNSSKSTAISSRPVHIWVFDDSFGHQLSFYEPQVSIAKCDRSVPLREILKYDTYVDHSHLPASWEPSYKGRLNSWGIRLTIDKPCHNCSCCGCSSVTMGQIDTSEMIPFWVSKGHAAAEEREMYRAIEIYVRMDEDYNELFRTKIFFENDMTKEGILQSLYAIARNQCQVI